MLGGYHGISLTECYANYEKNNKDIIKYLVYFYFTRVNGQQSK